MSIQLDLFETLDKTVLRELSEVKKQISNVRRGIFARFDKLTKEVEMLRQELAETRRFKEDTPQLELFERQCN